LSADPVVSAGEPFYYYANEKIALNQDPSRIIIQTIPGAGAGAVSHALAAVKLTAATLDTLPQAPRHYLLRMQAAVTPEFVDSTIAALRRDSTIAFASTAFKTVNGDDDVVLLNRLIVKFNPGVNAKQVDSLARGFGLFHILV